LGRGGGRKSCALWGQFLKPADFKRNRLTRRGKGRRTFFARRVKKESAPFNEKEKRRDSSLIARRLGVCRPRKRKRFGVNSPLGREKARSFRRGKQE